jgi:TRAP-type uncharacterized transport system substrate-binding protein
MPYLPRSANFRRAKLLWELGLHIAANPNTPYGGNRDMCIVVGSGSGEQFRPWLRMSTGSPILAQDVVNGRMEMAMVNPSALLTQAYRGVGLFKEPLPVRIIAVYPSWDRFVFAIRPETGIRSLRDIRERRYPLQVSVREDPTHSTHVLIDQALSYYGFSLADIESWGGGLHLVGPPFDDKRIAGIRNGVIEAIFDEGLVAWFEEALKAGFEPIELEPAAFSHMEALGWRKVVIPTGSASRYPLLKQPHACINYGGWPLYTSASLPDSVAYAACAAIAARGTEIPWEMNAYTHLLQLGHDTEATPIDVPLHPGAERWYRDHASEIGG